MGTQGILGIWWNAGHENRSLWNSDFISSYPAQSLTFHIWQVKHNWASEVESRQTKAVAFELINQKRLCHNFSSPLTRNEITLRRFILKSIPPPFRLSQFHLSLKFVVNSHCPTSYKRGIWGPLANAFYSRRYTQYNYYTQSFNNKLWSILHK